MLILGIETSCDETALALLEARTEHGETLIKRYGDELFSQIEIHKEFGGVFPMLAKREHAKNLVPLLLQLLKKTKLLETGTHGISKQRERITTILSREHDLEKNLINFAEHYQKPEIDCIAVTVGPGLEPALWVGLNFAFALKELWDIPVIPVNHMEGHVLSALLPHTTEKDGFQTLLPVTFPLLSLLISGGHTELILSTGWHNYEIIGQTRDDAVGEAFDKVARILGLPYPGGPEISKYAEIWRTKGNVSTIKLPRPMIASDNLDFSFSGLKTSVLYLVKKIPELTHELKQEIAAEFENAVTEVLVAKTKKAIEQCVPQTLTIGGGVIANKHIRTNMELLAKQYPGITLYLPHQHLTTDNAIMIALAGYLQLTAKKTSAEWEDVRANGNLRLSHGSPSVC